MFGVWVGGGVVFVGGGVWGGGLWGAFGGGFFVWGWGVGLVGLFGAVLGLGGGFWFALLPSPVVHYQIPLKSASTNHMPCVGVVDGKVETEDEPTRMKMKSITMTERVKN